MFGNRVNRSVNTSVIVLFAIQDNILRHRVFIGNSEGEFHEGIVKFIPERSELYSRSKGLLETSVLENCKIGVVGLGSGGSTVALELAKAGVGNFVLIDFDRLELENVARHICG
ncbi:MAG: ThiF family adenylyltransferase, partial [Oscillatoriales cyanobacterium]